MIARLSSPVEEAEDHYELQPGEYPHTGPEVLDEMQIDFRTAMSGRVPRCTTCG